MLFLSLFILGFSSLVSQIVMTRELIVSFYGNEFFIGWLLFGWLFWVGIGSVIIKSSQRLFERFTAFAYLSFTGRIIGPPDNFLDTIK